MSSHEQLLQSLASLPANVTTHARFFAPPEAHNDESPRSTSTFESRLTFGGSPKTVSISPRGVSFDAKGPSGFQCPSFLFGERVESNTSAILFRQTSSGSQTELSEVRGELVYVSKPATCAQASQVGNPEFGSAFRRETSSSSALSERSSDRDTFVSRVPESVSPSSLLFHGRGFGEFNLPPGFLGNEQAETDTPVLLCCKSSGIETMSDGVQGKLLSIGQPLSCAKSTLPVCDPSTSRLKKWRGFLYKKASSLKCLLSPARRNSCVQEVSMGSDGFSCG